MNDIDKIYVGGTFDLFHVGHLNIIKAAKKICNHVVVAVNGDFFSKSYKGDPPIINENERLEIVSSCKYVDEAFIVDTYESQREHILIISPKFILHGDDWKGESLYSQLNLTKDIIKDLKIEFVYSPYTKGISTTEIKKKILRS